MPPDQKIEDFQAALQNLQAALQNLQAALQNLQAALHCNTGFAKQNLVLNGDFVPVHLKSFAFLTEVNLHKILQNLQSTTKKNAHAKKSFHYKKLNIFVIKYIQ